MPNASRHYDWMCESPDPGAGLVTFRLPTEAMDPQRLLVAWLGSESGVLDLVAERIDPHRRVYLDYEGPVSGGRGTVRRVAAGAHTWAVFEPGRIVLTLTIGGQSHGVRVVAAGPPGGGAWVVRIETGEGAGE